MSNERRCAEASHRSGNDWVFNAEHTMSQDPVTERYLDYLRFGNISLSVFASRADSTETGTAAVTEEAMPPAARLNEDSDTASTDHQDVADKIASRTHSKSSSQTISTDFSSITHLPDADTRVKNCVIL